MGLKTKGPIKRSVSADRPLSVWKEYLYKRSPAIRVFPAILWVFQVTIRFSAVGRVSSIFQNAPVGKFAPFLAAPSFRDMITVRKLPPLKS